MYIFKKSSKGFTLLELMICIGILVTLMSFVIPAMQRGRANARLSACMQTIKNLATCIETYAVENHYQGPPPGDTLGILIPDYLRSIPKEQNEEYVYIGPESASKEKNYTIHCPGANFHLDVGVPAYHPFYTPLTGETQGLGVK
ncbi:MAG TPA: type II secretion system protein [Candidatus Eremiobacteraeota bacterium]|nr:MAG: putative major pilin subunit [bacterium ADurb.Bin363]HPZ09457.1 type II secretion system protein [Candidatus Eremiobacteraeota bacterium]